MARMAHIEAAMNSSRCSNKEHENSSAPVSLKCPACGHEFSINEAVLAGLRANIANDLQADMRKHQCELEAKTLANREKEASLAKKEAEFEQRLESMLKSRLEVKLEELR